MAESAERHNREKAAQAGRAAGGVSRESVRKARRITTIFADGGEALASGNYTINELWKLAHNDTRVGVYILIAAELRDAINAEAKYQGVTRQQLLNDLLTQIFGDRDSG